MEDLQIKLGIIDLGYRETSDSVTSISEIIDYAVEAENYGFSRFWLAEHHYTHIQNHPYTNPDILISLIAGSTERIKIASAGTSINLYTPYATVSTYKLLNNLFYDRIALGLSKGIPDSTYIQNACNVDRNNNFSKFQDNFREIIDLLENEEENLQSKSVLIPPYKGLKPELWHLSTSFNTFHKTVDINMNHCISVFHNFGQDIHNLGFDKDHINRSSQEFYSIHERKPGLTISLAIILEDTLSVAKEKVENLEMEAKKNSVDPFIIIPSTIDTLQELLQKWQQDFGIHEFIIYDLAPTNDEKINNLKKISEKFSLSV
ncbi:LLM class flavin-dependent oxidoreductase [Chryseobacterium lactis]|uniref:LLM class flavin-dependent oxidoreductase n=1 Tax=Chryseobacterium lactis TaxID=1241981 RepID=A0A3G6RT47_CHRLC|nr:LLM class flavin-dependent oxidoreductase [Chryseobacterium lactis]AZA84272.1 LLM class flavin-dependent oxidoreductase [Chryseobacterium lactis]AZB04660.1 LLM class flavin-dependent oxidoreductase [Chryseobacterium lactis]PNW14391.1 LLM class flavin-dependent oxidoreductase [Chryseobacterium lactis]